MAIEQGVLRRISWRDLFPWLILFRTFRIAISPSLLALATAASILSFRRLAGVGVRLHSPRRRSKLGQSPAAGGYPSARNSQLNEYHLPDAVRPYLPAAPDGFFDGYFELAEPWQRLFQLEAGLTLGESAYFAFGTLWTLDPVGVCRRRHHAAGGRAARHGRTRWAFVPAVKFAGRRYLWYFLTPLYPLLGVVLLAIPIAILGLPTRLGRATAWLVGSVARGTVLDSRRHRRPRRHVAPRRPDLRLAADVADDQRRARRRPVRSLQPVVFLCLWQAAALFLLRRRRGAVWAPLLGRRRGRGSDRPGVRLLGAVLGRRRRRRRADSRPAALDIAARRSRRDVSE